MDYKKVKIKLKPWNEDMADILVAMLSSIGYESFTTEGDALSAYIGQDQFNHAEVEELLHEVLTDKTVYSADFSTIAAKNWNEVWESNFEPVLIDELCYVRAPFHEELKNIPYSILIEPKMSFGTGHHATTALMISTMLDLNIKCKVVLDMGCGTGLLSILASKMGAHHVTSIDIEEWAYQNCIENAALNTVPNMSILQGDVSLINGLFYNVILANINLNVLLRDISAYSACLTPGGVILLSGFFKSDSSDIIACAQRHSLKHLKTKNKNNWASLLFSK